MRIGIVGAGGMGGVHARHHRNIPGAEVAVCDLEQEKASALAKKWGIGLKGSFEEVLAWADLVDLCTPTPSHLDLGLRTIAEGKALFVEKPIAGSLADAAKLVEEATRAGVPLMPGQVVRFFPEFETGNRLVHEGAIGKPGAARTRRGGGMPQGHGLWFSDHALSGGVLLDLAIHDFDWLRWTLGEVESVFSRSLGAQTGSGPDYALTTLKFEEGAVAHVEATWLDPAGFRTTFEVCGSGGMIEFDSRNAPSLRTHTPEARFAEGPLAGTDDPYYKQLSGFVAAIRENREPPVTGWDGLMAVAISEAALQSAREGRAVRPARLA
jgi:UDP-N-acetylglucosamine 3-dehydrogenase